MSLGNFVVVATGACTGGSHFMCIIQSFRSGSFESGHGCGVVPATLVVDMTPVVIPTKDQTVPIKIHTCGPNKGQHTKHTIHGGHLGLFISLFQ